MGSPLAVYPPVSCCPAVDGFVSRRRIRKDKPRLQSQSNLTPSRQAKGRQVMGTGSKQTLKLGRCIFKSFLLATVQNHGGEGSGPVPASPQSPPGSGAKYKKRITNTAGGWGAGDSVSCRRQGPGPAHSLALTLRILKDTDCKSL